MEEILQTATKWKSKIINYKKKPKKWTRPKKNTKVKESRENKKSMKKKLESKQWKQ